jgi:hypothetical protein
MVDAGGRFRDLAPYVASIDGRGTVAFQATLENGSTGVFISDSERVPTVAVAADSIFSRFDSHPDIGDDGSLCFYATPGSGQLGVYAGPDPAAHGIVSIGQPLFGSTVTDFALNPVSLNDAGQVAIRVKLADGRQFILRADPVW